MKMILQSSRGDSLELTNNDYCELIGIDGQTLAEASISSLATPGVDGDRVTLTQVNPREITLDLHIKGEVETSKRAILSVIKIKSSCALHWTQDDRTLKLSGTVERVEMARWENGVTMQVDLYCSNPYWMDLDDTHREIDEVEDEHYFTTSADDMLYFPEDGIPFGLISSDRGEHFTNEGDVDLGMIITIKARGAVTNPLITNSEGEFFGLTGVSLAAGESIVINTNRGSKSVKKGSTNLYDKILTGSTWLQLKAGMNQFTISASETAIDNMTVEFVYRQKFV